MIMVAISTANHLPVFISIMTDNLVINAGMAEVCVSSIGIWAVHHSRKGLAKHPLPDGGCSE